MINEYIVTYAIGKTYAQLQVSAHSKEEAEKITPIQAHYRHKSQAKIRIINIRSIDEKDPFLELDEKYLVKRA